MLRYLFMGTPAFAASILEKLCTDLYPPVAVVTQVAKAVGRHHHVTPSAVEQYARTQDLNVLESPDVNSPLTFDPLKTFQPDLILVAAFGQILRQPLLDLPKIACLNVHGSLLPKYRGAAPVQRAIMDGDKKTGITIQKMAKKLDTGDILLQKETEILPTETSGDLMSRLAELSGVALVEAIRLIESGNFQFVPQDHVLATYAKKLEKAEANLDWNLPGHQLECIIRGLQPWPVAQGHLGQVPLRIFRAEVAEGKSGLKPGEIHTDSKSFIHVQCGDGRALSLTEIQLENRKRLKVHEFLMGYRGSFPFQRMENLQ